MTKRTVYNGGTVINENGNFILTRPQNSQDMNYHIYDTENDTEYLIDISDVYDSEEEEEEEEEEYGGILWEELKAFEEIDYILENVWKIIED